MFVTKVIEIWNVFLIFVQQLNTMSNEAIDRALNAHLILEAFVSVLKNRVPNFPDDPLLSDAKTVIEVYRDYGADGLREYLSITGNTEL